jgi:hypothetical protein
MSTEHIASPFDGARPISNGVKKPAFPSFFTYLLCVALLALPLALRAEETRAGFPAQNIWLSKTTATAGENVTLYTALYNSGVATLRGTLVFAVDGAAIASKAFELQAGQTRIESAEWKAVAGSHSFSASIKDVSGAGAGQAASIAHTSSVLRISIAEPPPPSALQQGITTVTNVAGAVASSTIPVVTTIAENLIGATEAFREAGIAYAEKKLAEKVSGAETVGKTSGTATEGFDSPSKETTETVGIFSKLGQLAAPGILFTFTNPALFYFLLCLLLLLCFYLLARWVNRPRF